MVFKIIQWNARSIAKNKEPLQYFMHTENIVVACMQETWLKPGQYLNIPGYNIILMTG